MAVNDSREQTLNRSSDIRVSKVKVLLLYNYYETIYNSYVYILKNYFPSLDYFIIVSFINYFIIIL